MNFYELPPTKVGTIYQELYLLKVVLAVAKVMGAFDGAGVETVFILQGTLRAKSHESAPLLK